MKRTISLRIGVTSGGQELSISQVHLTDNRLIAVSELKPIRGGGIASYTWREAAIEIEVKDGAHKNFSKLPVDHYVVSDNKEGNKIAHDELTTLNSSESCSCILKFFEKAPTTTVQFIEGVDEIQGLIKNSTLIYSKDKTSLVRTEQEEKRPEFR